jgi:hypothetical protein
MKFLFFLCVFFLLCSGSIFAADHGHDHHDHDGHDHGHDHEQHEGHDEHEQGGQQQKEEENTVQPIPEQLEGSPDIVTDFIFPNLTSHRSVGGEPIEVLMTLTNNGESSFKIHTISCSLRHPLDYRYIIQNFSSWEYGSVIGSREEMSFAYTFFPWELEERDYYLLLTVEYQDMEDRLYQTAFFNGTFTLTEPPAAVDGKTFFTYCGLLAAVILIVFLYYKTKSNPQTKQRAKPEKVKNSSEKISIENEWLKGTTAHQFTKQHSKKQ